MFIRDAFHNNKLFVVCIFPAHGTKTLECQQCSRIVTQCFLIYDFLKNNDNEIVTYCLMCVFSSSTVQKLRSSPYFGIDTTKFVALSVDKLSLNRI